MAWPLDTDIFINYLRETCLSAAPNSQDKIISGFYNAENVKQNIDTNKQFPLLSSILNNSPPISPYILDNQFTQRFSNDSLDTMDSFKKQTKFKFDHKDISPEPMHSSVGEKDPITDHLPPAISPPLPPVKSPPLPPQSANLSSSISSSESDKSSLSAPKTAPPPIPEHSLANISQSTTIKSEERSLTSENSKVNSIVEVTPPLPARPQLSFTSIRKPSVQSTTDSIDSGISNGSNIKQSLTENNGNSSNSNSNSYINNNSNGNNSSLTSNASKQSLPQPQVPTKSKNKGILSLGRFIRPKHITSTLQHHSNIIDEEKTISSAESSIDKNFSNTNLNSNESNDNLSMKSKNTVSNYKSYSESNLIDHFEKEHFKKHNRHKSNLSHDRRDLESHTSSKNKNENGGDDYDDEEEDDENGDGDNNDKNNNDDGKFKDIGSSANNNLVDKHDVEKSVRKPDNLIDESDEYDDEDDDSDVVDSIESSEIVDDDYDYFNSTYLDHSFAGDDEFSDDLDSDDYLSDSDYLVSESLNDQGMTEIDNIPNTNNGNLVSKINFTSSRPVSSGIARHRSTSLKWKKSFPSIQNLQNLQLSHDQIKGLKRNVKSSNSLVSIKTDLSYDNNNHQKKNDGDSNKKDEFVFEKLDLNDIKNKKNKDINNNNNDNDTNNEDTNDNNCTNNIPSKLTLLINKKTISLDYYKYVELKKSEFDNLINIKVMIPVFNINYENELKLRINDSVHVFELIGYILYKLNDNIIKENSEKHFEANYWKLYLADDDGEVEDDLGVLDRTRIVKSYGADEFVLIECSKDEIKLNEKLTPSPLENGNNNNNTNTNTNTNTNRQGSIANSGSGYNNNGTILESITPQVRHTRDISVATLPSNLTPSSELAFDNNNSPQLYNRQKTQKKGKKAFVDEDYDSEEEEEEEEEEEKEGRSDYDGNNVGKLKSNNGKNISENYGHGSDHYKKHSNSDKKYNYITSKFNSTPKDSKLNKFKNHNKTIQTILHNTASYYQQQRQELFRNPNANEIDEFNNANNLTMYHRWTVWRRQQMTFKNKHPKTLAVDGYQIYILPFNEFKGSWYESKTYSFNISQILKVKQNAKVPNYFKIVINKNADGIVKKYYLEAKNASECKEIVDTIRGLAAGYNENPMV